MYECSNAFHEAAASNAPQMALFIFPDGVITNEDIDMEAGVEFIDYFCTEKELGIGEALSNELNFKIFNVRQLLNDFPFGEFDAMLGVMIDRKYMDEGIVLDYEGHRFSTSYKDGRHLMRDGKPTNG